MSNLTLPIDGRGGSFYYTPISVPVYDWKNHTQTISWAYLDSVLQGQSTDLVLYAVCFGLLLTTALQILALTPSTKRGLPLYTFSLLGIAFEEARLLLLIITFTRSGNASAYLLVTGDYTSSRFSNSTLAEGMLSQLCAPFAFLFVQLCFLMQGRAVLSALAVTHRLWYNLILGILVAVGVVTFLYRLAYAIWVCVSYSTDIPFPPHLVVEANSVLYATSIGLWSLVFVVQVGHIIRRRLKLGGSFQRSEALNILLLTGVESMIIPLACAITQAATINWLGQPEILIIPSVLVLIPFGSLWAGSMQSYDKRSHTFTRSSAGVPMVNSSGSPPSAGGDSNVSGAVRNYSGCSGSTIVKSRMQTTGLDLYRPMGIQDALVERDLDEHDHELEDKPGVPYQRNTLPKSTRAEVVEPV